MVSLLTILCTLAVAPPLAVLPEIQLVQQHGGFPLFSEEVLHFLKQLSQSTLLLTSADYGQDHQHEVESLINFYSISLRSSIILRLYSCENNSQDSNVTELSFNYQPPFSKFNAHRAQLLLHSITDFLRQNETGLSSIPRLLYDLKGPQDIYVIFSVWDARNQSLLLKSLKVFKGLSVPSPFVFIWHNRQVQMLCTFCPFEKLPSGPLFYSVQGLSLHQVAELYARVHGKLRQKKVELRGIEGVNHFCDAYLHGTFDDAVTCSLFQVLSNVNATIISNSSVNLPNRWDKESVSYVAGWIYVGSAEHVLNKSRLVQYDWVISGAYWDLFSFVNVVDADATGLSGFWQAIDPELLPVISTAAFAVTVVLSFVLKSFASALALILSLSVESFYLRKSYRRNMPVLLVLITFAWSQTSTVLNNSYKGHLFKSLASTSIPAVPHDMEALSKSDEFAFFTSRILSGNGVLPLFHHEIELVLQRRHISASAQDRQEQVLGAFSNKLVFSNLYTPELAAAQTPLFPNKTVTFQASDNTTMALEIPFSHIYADEAVKVKSYTLLLSLLSPIADRTFVYGRNGLPMFTQRTPLFAQKNFLLPIITQKLLTLESSGIFGKWEKSSQAAIVDYYIDAGIRLVANYGVTVKQPQRILLPLIYENLNSPKEENTAKPLSIGFMVGPFQALCFGLVVSTLPFIVELIGGCVRWRKDKVRRLSKSWVIK